MTARRKVYIIDDEPVIRASMVSLLRARGDLDTREFSSGTALLAEIGDLAPGCVILDLQGEGGHGASLMQALALRPRDFRTIVVTDGGDVRAAVKAFQAGAVDFLYKPYEMKALMDAIDRALHLLEYGEEPEAIAEARAAIARMTPAEGRLLQELIDGRTNHEIALALGVDERSVQLLRARMLEALDASTLLAAIRIAMIAGHAPD